MLNKMYEIIEMLEDNEIIKGYEYLKKDKKKFIISIKKDMNEYQHQIYVNFLEFLLENNNYIKCNGKNHSVTYCCTNYEVTLL